LAGQQAKDWASQSTLLRMEQPAERRQLHVDVLESPAGNTSSM
jgi:hypothetical protein